MIDNVKINNYKIALVEVEAVLNCLENDDYGKIPKEIIEAININKDENYIFEYDDNLNFKDWNLMTESKAILYNILKKYLATDEQKQYFIEKEKLEIMQIEREKAKKYNVDELFKKKEENENSKSLIEFKKEKWYKQILNFIKSLFNQN